MGASQSTSNEVVEGAAVKLQAAARGKACRKDVESHKLQLTARKYVNTAGNWTKKAAKKTMAELVNSGLLDQQNMEKLSEAIVASSKGTIALTQPADKREGAAATELKASATATLDVLKTLNPLATEPASAQARVTAFTFLSLLTLAYAFTLLALGGFWAMAFTGSPWILDLIGLTIQLAIVAPIYYLAYFIFVVPAPKRAWWQAATVSLLLFVALATFACLGMLWWPFVAANMVLAAAGYLIWKEDSGSLMEPYNSLEEEGNPLPEGTKSSELV